MPAVIHISAPDPHLGPNGLKALQVFPDPAYRLEDLASPNQLLVVTDCFWHSLPKNLPNPIVVLHRPHQCLAQFVPFIES